MYKGFIHRLLRIHLKASKNPDNTLRRKSDISFTIPAHIGTVLLTNSNGWISSGSCIPLCRSGQHQGSTPSSLPPMTAQ